MSGLSTEMAGENGRSITDVLQDIVANIQTIIRSEVRLARTEVTEELTKGGRASGMLASGAISALFTIWLLLLTILFALATVMPFWAAALLLFVVMAAVTAVLLSSGKKRLKSVHAIPEKTVETMKENIEWMKSQTK
ncbi:MAG TPA: phage holin family protein [Bryobacteraceae bacterium]|nr:phage holin family protein [Bryobacteraceae bacterium]